MISVVVVAAGSGSRLGAAQPKALVRVAGRSLLGHALQRLPSDVTTDLVVVCAPGHRSDFEAVLPHLEARLVEGGATRGESVRAGLAAAAASDLIAVHDAARPFMPPDVYQRAVAAVERGAVAAAPTLPVADTLKRVTDGRIVTTVNRDGIHGVQTPQAFRRDVLDAVLAWSGAHDATDEVGLVEAARRAGVVHGDIVAVAGSPLGFKVTFPADLQLAELIAGSAVDG